MLPVAWIRHLEIHFKGGVDDIENAYFLLQGLGCLPHNQGSVDSSQTMKSKSGDSRSVNAPTISQ